MLNKRSLLSQFLHFSAATVASLMVFSLYSIVDGLFVAKGVGEYAMSAVNLAVPFTNVMFSIAVLFAVGTSTIIAIYLGQGSRENANSLFSQNLAVLVVIGLVVNVATTGPSGALSSVVGLVLSILYVMGAKENKDAHAMAGKV